MVDAWPAVHALGQAGYLGEISDGDGFQDVCVNVVLDPLRVKALAACDLREAVEAARATIALIDSVDELRDLSAVSDVTQAFAPSAFTPEDVGKALADVIAGHR